MKMDVKIPSVGESISSGIISVWNRKNGDRVKKGDTLLTLETDKVTTEIAAEADGILDIHVEEGREVKIGEVVASLLPAEEQAPEQPAETPASFAPPQGPPVGPPRTEPVSTPPPPPPSKPTEQSEESAAPRILSPAARRLSEEEKVEPSQVEPTGPGGRITKEDVMAFLQSRAQDKDQSTQEAPAQTEEADAEVVTSTQTPASPDATAMVPATQVTESHTEAITTRKRLSPLRRKIAEQLVRAQQDAALLTTFNECDLTQIKAVREGMQESFQKRHGVKLGFMSFFVKAVVNALQEMPALNGRIDGEDFVQNHFYDIGVAVGTDRGLMVPVIRAADRKSFGEVEKALADYAVKAREGKITLDDLQGGVFTISNGGVYGSLLSTPIVNPPQSGILGMHKIQDRAVVIDGEVVVRPMMYLALTYDHRVVDGKEAVTFLVKVKEGLEDPMSLLL